MIRIGILSVAHGHAESYAAHLRAHPGVELVGLSRHLDRLLRYMGPQSAFR